MGVRLSSGLISIIAAGVVAPSNASTLWLLSPGKRAIIKKIMWINRTGGGGFLRIGYDDRVAPVAGPNFTQVLPDILMVAGVDGAMREEDLPICGNTREGFAVDTTANTGTVGNIMAESSVGGAAPNDVMVEIEVEEIG